MKNLKITFCVLVLLGLIRSVCIASDEGVMLPYKEGYQQALQLFRNEFYQEALALAQKTLVAISNEKGESDKECLVVINLIGITQLHLGMDALAEDSFNTIISTLEQNKQTNTKLYGITLENLGSMYLLQEYYDMAEDSYRRAFKNFKKVLGEEHIRVAVILNSWGLLYLQNNQLKKAEEKLSASRKAFKESKNSLQGEKGVMFHNLGELYLKLEDFKKAELNAKRALKAQIKMTVKATRRKAATYDLLKRIYEAKGDKERTLEMMNKRDELKSEIPDKASAFVTDLLIWKIDKI